MVGFVAVLTAAAGISDAAVAEVVRRLADRAGAPHRQSARAVDVPFAAGTAPDLGAFDGFDVNVLAANGRRKQVLIADMDSTIITVECIDELADAVGQKARVAEITERAMQGELDFEQALDSRVALLAGVTQAQIAACYDERVRVSDGAEALVRAMNARGAITALVSGGFTVFTDRVAGRVGFAMSRANTLEFADGILSGTVARPIVTSDTKLETLQSLCKDRGVALTDAVAIGDGANDAKMVAAAGLGVAYRAKPALRAVADAVLDHSDLTAVLALQGIDS